MNWYRIDIIVHLCTKENGTWMHHDAWRHCFVQAQSEDDAKKFALSKELNVVNVKKINFVPNIGILK